MANRGKSIEALNEQEAYALLLAEESLILDTQIAIQSVLNEKGITQADLAQKMGVSESYISQMLGASARNLTLRTVARIMSALGEIPHVTIRRRLEEFCQRSKPYECDADFGPWGQVLDLATVISCSTTGITAQDWAANENSVTSQDWATAA
jgi:transcriptional regulator with XRE-family HTH domain